MWTKSRDLVREATARDVRTLIDKMRRTVKERFGNALVPESEVFPPPSVE